MNKTLSEIRFEKARKKLSDALKNLEEATKEKIHHASITATMIDIKYDNKDKAVTSLAEQLALIKNLNEEVNNLQRNLFEVGKETEFLREKNKSLLDKFDKFRAEGLAFIEAVEADLAGIEQVIENYDC